MADLPALPAMPTVICRYTGVSVPLSAAKIIGPVVPGVRARYYMADTDVAQAAHRAAGISFHESEANCNTCHHIEREKRDKRPDGFHFGRCLSAHGRPDVGDSYYDGDTMKFHPDDPMHKPCYESRWAAAAIRAMVGKEVPGA